MMKRGPFLYVLPPKLVLFRASQADTIIFAEDSFAPNRSDETFDVAVLPRRARRGRMVADTHCPNTPEVSRAEDPVAVAKHMTRRFIPGESRAASVGRDFQPRARFAIASRAPGTGWHRLQSATKSTAYSSFLGSLSVGIRFTRSTRIPDIFKTADYFCGSQAYAASKGALANLTRQLAVEWAEYGINVNALSPGMIPTELNQRALAMAGIRERTEAFTPMGRLGSADEIRGAVIFLASAASSFMTGASVAIDGGYTAW
jgi:NAD(P)-dependent dehydrogenase (short-subunit alcohol dehydrogenase family)